MTEHQRHTQHTCKSFIDKKCQPYLCTLFLSIQEDFDAFETIRHKTG